MSDFERAAALRRIAQLESFLASSERAGVPDFAAQAQAASHAQELGELRRELAAAPRRSLQGLSDAELAALSADLLRQIEAERPDRLHELLYALHGELLERLHTAPAALPAPEQLAALKTEFLGTFAR